MADLEFDVAVIGTGTSAYNAAHPLARAGRRVAMIDERPYGGTCAMRGCQPKKYLVRLEATLHDGATGGSVPVSGEVIVGDLVVP